jgi:hypothetical protein
MSDFFGSLGSDLRDRRFLPILLVLGVALLAALAFAVLGGGGGASSPSTPAPSASSSGPAGKVGAIAIVKAPESSTSQAVAETTSGSAQHGSGAPRNPFKPLSSPKASSASTSSNASSAGSSSSPASSGSTSSGSGGSASSGGGSEPAPSKPSAPAKPKYYIHFHTTVQFGLVPTAPEGAPAQLKTYPDMTLNEPLPSKTEPQLVYLGVTVKTGKDAAFGLTGEAILKGSAVCKPSPSQCEAIELQAGQSETLEVIDPTGQAKTYELKLVAIEKTVSTSASTARAAAKAAAAVDRNGALRASGLRFSPGSGGLVFIGRSAFGTHAARHR